MRARSTLLLTLTLSLAPIAQVPAQVSLRELAEIARARAERLRPRQIAALEPFWADLALTYEGNEEFLDRRIREAADLGDSVVPLLLEKLKPAQGTDSARYLAGNCGRVLVLLDPGSFVDALVELARGTHGIARQEAIKLLGHADVPQAVTVLGELVARSKNWDLYHVVKSLRQLAAPGPAPQVVKLLGGGERVLRKEVLSYLTAAEASAVAPTVVQALSAETDERLLASYVDYFAACVRRDEQATAALLPLLDRERLDWQDTLNLIKAFAVVAPRRHEPTLRRLHELVENDDTSSLAVNAAVSLRALGDKSGVTRLRKTLDEKLRRRKREAALYEQRARLLFAIEDYADAADDYKKIIDYAEGTAMTRRAYQGLLKSEARRSKIQNVVKYMKSSGMTPEEFERLAAQDAPFRAAMEHDRVQSFLRQLRRSRAPK